MPDSEDLQAVRWAFHESHVRMTTHAVIEASTEKLGPAEIRLAGMEAELLEDYPERPHGHTQLLLGYARRDEAIHIVVNVDAFERDYSEPLVIVTIYRPEPPSWADERTRGVRA